MAGISARHREIERSRGEAGAALGALGYTHPPLGFLGYRLTQLRWLQVWDARPDAVSFYLVLFLSFFVQPVADLIIYRNLLDAGQTLPLIVLLRKRYLNNVMLEYSGEAYFFFWAQQNLKLKKGILLHAVKDTNFLSAGAGLATVWLMLLALVAPLFWIFCAATVFRLAGMTWGLPASDGWDDDGVAPRNFLVGLVETYKSGSYFAYPPLHMFVLAIPTSPGWIIALFKARSLTQHDVIAEFIQLPYMTFFSVVSRLVSAAMSVGTIFLIGKMTETIGGRRAAYAPLPLVRSMRR